MDGQIDRQKDTQMNRYNEGWIVRLTDGQTDRLQDRLKYGRKE